MSQTTGKRRDLQEGQYAMEQGEYGKTADSEWACSPPAPGFGMGKLIKHTVVEHDDGTITVSPSILFYGRNGNPNWHGYLERGIWREV